jgi:hypothetical protein
MGRPGPGDRCGNLAVVVVRSGDGSAGDADYGAIGTSYARYRRPDARIATRIGQALGAARTVLNVGAGAGSYEPAGRQVTPVEPSASMRAQRPAGLAAAVDDLSRDLADGTWDDRYGRLRTRPAFDGSLLLVTSPP